MERISASTSARFRQRDIALPPAFRSDAYGAVLHLINGKMSVDVIEVECPDLDISTAHRESIHTAGLIDGENGWKARPGRWWWRMKTDQLSTALRFQSIATAAEAGISTKLDQASPGFRQRRCR